MTKLVFFCLLLTGTGLAQTNHDTVTLDFQVTYQGKRLALDQESDSLLVTAFRFYVGQFQLFHHGRVICRPNQPFHLIDLEDNLSGKLCLTIPAGLNFDEVSFLLGTDSLSNVSGALGGDLDPTKGMYWAWNSGFINIKLEGQFPASQAKNHEFQFHLGGYLPPFQSAQRVRLKTNAHSRYRVQLELSPLLTHAAWPTKHHLMSPSAESVRLSSMLAQSFSLHAY